MSTDRRLKGAAYHKLLFDPVTRRPLCRFCRANVFPPRQTFCSENCVRQWRLRTSPSFLRKELFRRNKGGRCQICGVDTVLQRRDLNALRRDRPAYQALCEKLSIPLSRAQDGGQLWDADHEIPVAEGGGVDMDPTVDGLSNIALICIACHARKTAEQALRRAEQARKK